MIKKFVSFISEVRTEMTRVTWPTRPELQSSTTVVIVVSLAFSIFILFVDRILTKLFEIIFRF